ncbi:MAG: serine/threonine protein kinase [Myxococcaceae bacterium]|nr:serine/threonine protein kinase [Myxococcaceae bacterium]
MSPPSCARCGEALPEGGVCPSCLLSAVGVTFAGLELGDELGRGGMGTVFRAHHRALGRDVAVKVLSPELSKDAEARARFEREAHALARLDHPHIVRVHDAGVEDEDPFVVMELVEGGPVSRRLPLPVADAVRVTRQVCEALAYAHERGVIHRDVKPENVLLDARGDAKLGDFGIARLVGPDARAFGITRSEVAVGSVGYMAPEVLEGAPPAPTMDVYSAGALLRSLLTGRPPVGDVEALPLGLDRVVRRAMAARPLDRFPDARALGAALEATSALPPDERFWMHAVALLQTAAIATVLWAALLSLTPRVLEQNDLLPLVAIGTQPAGPGQVLTRARFETGAVLTALVAVAVALAGTAALRRHWRLEGLDHPRPEAPLPQRHAVLGLGVFTLATYTLRLWAVSKGAIPTEEAGPSWLSYLPFFGGLLELVMLFFTVSAVLEATRRHRPLSAEPALVAGQLLALVPPVAEFIRTL